MKRRRPCKTGKKPYYSEVAAIRAALRYAANPRMKVSRAYRCNYCRRWHLTTQLREVEIWHRN